MVKSDPRLRNQAIRALELLQNHTDFIIEAKNIYAQDFDKNTFGDFTLASA